LKGSPGANTTASLLEGEVEKVLAEFPNDLARLIYLASVRDYNTGFYFHPELSRSHSVELLDRSFRRHHERIFSELLEAPVRSYVDQLALYISYAGVTREELIRTWKGLEAYKSTIPLQADKVMVELFCLNILSALCVLEQS
jgi:hypothetical protein